MSPRDKSKIHRNASGSCCPLENQAGNRPRNRGNSSPECSTSNTIGVTWLSKYQPLTDYLGGTAENAVELSFTETGLE